MTIGVVALAALVRLAPPATAGRACDHVAARRDARVGSPPIPHRQRRHAGRGRRGRCRRSDARRRPAPRRGRQHLAPARGPAQRPADCRRPVAVRARDQPARRAERRLLPDRHGPARAPGRHPDLAARPGRDGRSTVLAHVRRAPRHAAVRAVRDDRLREQPGGREPRRQRALDGRPAQGPARAGRRPGGRDPDRRSVGRRLHGGLPDRLGHRSRSASRWSRSG